MSTTRLQSRIKSVLKILLFTGFTFSIFAVQLAGISDHLLVNFSSTHRESFEVSSSETMNSHESPANNEKLPFHQMHVHGNFHVHDFVVYPPFQINTSIRVSKLDLLRASHWLPYDYIASLFRPPLDILPV